MKLLSSCALLVGLLLGMVTAAGAAEEKRPNVLFLFTDDQRADTISALGNPHIKTPNLDRLARSAMVFTNAYCMGGNVGAVCLPSRRMLLSGRTFFRFGTQPAPEPPNFPHSMKQAGYITYHHGKTGNTPKEIQQQFDYNFYLQDLQARTTGQPGKEIVEAAIDFLKTAPKERPFFMYLAFGSPHDPRVAAQEYLDQYQRERIPLPKNYLPVHPFDNGEITIRDEQLAPWPRTEDEIRKHLHDYYAVITGLDNHIGRLLDALKAQRQYENTLIVFSSDHGLAIGSHGLMGKQNLYEDGMKCPLLFAGAGIKPGRTDALAYLHDIYPTVCDLVGAEAPPGLDGKSLKGVIEDKAPGVRDSLFTAYRGVQRAVRDERWKLIRYPEINRSQLFDLKNDPHELNDLADDPSHAAEIARLTKLMEQWQQQLADATPLTSAQPKDPRFTPPSGTPEAKKAKR
jgi:arylsulfatase A-like enzyme